MNILVEKSQLKGEVNIIPSKSYAHRILICSAFCNDVTIIKDLPNSADILATISCLKSLGVKLEQKGNLTIVTPTIIKEYNSQLNANESGSTLRFMLPIVSALGGNYIIKGTQKLISRPNLPLLNTLKENGIDFFVGEDYIKINGKLKSGNFNIDASLSSQYLTGLMLASPILNFQTKINCTKLSSTDYIEITKDVLFSFGVKVEKNNNQYNINGKYISPKEIKVEGDYSNALFFAVGGLLCGDVFIKGLNKNSKQGDKKAFDILKNAGAIIVEEDNGLRFKKSTLNYCEFSIDDIPDSAPCLSLAFLTANGKTIIKNVDRLKIKESDRLFAILDFINKAGGIAEYKENTLIVNGNNVLHGGELSTFNDHRLCMTLAILGCLVGNVKILNAESVNKSYPDFFKVLGELGGKFCIS